jgi:hypothetical protein
MDRHWCLDTVREVQNELLIVTRHSSLVPRPFAQDFRRKGSRHPENPAGDLQLEVPLESKQRLDFVDFSPKDEDAGGRSQMAGLQRILRRVQ